LDRGWVGLRAGLDEEVEREIEYFVSSGIGKVISLNTTRNLIFKIILLKK
jgi:hypothetical protein